MGPLTLHRAYYHCAGCRRGIYPRDRALGLQDTSLSPATARMVGLAATSVSFAEASEWMGELAGVAVDPKQVERTAEALGREVAMEKGLPERGRDRRAEVRGGRPAGPLAAAPSLAVQFFLIPLAKSSSGPSIVAKAIYGAATDLAAQWGKARRDELDAGRIDAILTARLPT